MNENNVITLVSLDDLLEKHIIKYGKEKTHAILLYTLKAKNPLIKNDHIIADFIVDCVINNFKLNPKNPKKFIKTNTLFYKKGKVSCYFLIKHHTNFSYEDIRLFFDLQSIGPVQYGCKKIEDILTQPNIDRDHAQLHKQTGQQVQDFIDQIKN